jgi:hypothetical protein
LEHLDRRRGDDPLHPARELGVEGDERVRLELGERDVLGVVGLGPALLLGDLPGATPKRGVSEQADRHRPDPGEPLEGDVGRRLPLCTASCRPAGADVLSIGEERRSLEDVYLELIDDDVEARR